MSGERPIALSLKSMNAPRGVGVRSAGPETTAVGTRMTSLARPEIYLPSPFRSAKTFAEKFTPKSPMGAQRLTPLSVDSSEIRVSAPRILGAYAPLSEFAEKPREQTVVQHKTLPSSEVSIFPVAVSSREQDSKRKPVIAESDEFQSPQRREPVYAPLPLGRYRVRRNEIREKQVTESPLPAQTTEVPVQNRQLLEVKSDTSALQKEEILTELAQIAKKPVPTEIQLPIRTATLLPIAPSIVPVVRELTTEMHSPSDGSLEPVLRQKGAPDTKSGASYIRALKILRKKREDQGGTEPQRSEQPQALVAAAPVAMQERNNPKKSLIPPRATSAATEGATPMVDKKKKNGLISILKNVVKERMRKKEMRKKIYFKVDKPTQEVRIRDAFAAIDRYADKEGNVNGQHVAEAIGNDTKGSLISAILRKLGYAGEENFIDGSIVKVKSIIARTRLQKKKNMKTIVLAATTDAPAIDANENPDGSSVGEREVNIVLGEKARSTLAHAA